MIIIYIQYFSSAKRKREFVGIDSDNIKDVILRVSLSKASHNISIKTYIDKHDKRLIVTKENYGIYLETVL